MFKAQNQRLKYVDSAKGIGILMIAWGHLDKMKSPVFVLFSASKLAVFFILSGLMFAHRWQVYGKKEDCRSIIQKRLYSLLIPYLVYSLFAILFHIAFAADSYIGAKSIITDDLLMTISLRGMSTLWFLPTLFFGEVMFAATNVYDWSKAKRGIVTVSLPIAAIALAVCYQKIIWEGYKCTIIGYLLVVFAKSMVAFWFIQIGYYSYEFMNCVKYNRLLIILIAGLVSIPLSMLNTGVDFNNLAFGKDPLLFFVNGVAGSLFLLALLKQLEKYCSLAVTSFCGRNSLFIMATHLPWYLCTAVSLLGKKICCLETGNGYYILILLELIVVMQIEVLLIYCKHWLKSLLLKRADAHGVLARTLRYL